jgi:hypothetical protein
MDSEPDEENDVIAKASEAAKEPASAEQTAAPTPKEETPAEPKKTVDKPQPPAHKSKRRKPKLKYLLLVIVILLVAGAFTVGRLPELQRSGTIDSGKYQAVFLVNGQVYFGKLSKVNKDYMKLTGVYYLQTTQPPTSTSPDGSTNPQQTNSLQTPDIQLIKLGSEVHGPDDEMVISEKQILFFENLKKDGKVSASIDNYQKQKK